MKNVSSLIAIFISMLVNSCDSTTSRFAAPEVKKFAGTQAENPALPPVSYDHHEVVRALRQPKNMDCWATALTILYSWKYKDNAIGIEDVVTRYGDIYSVLFQTNAGITAKLEAELYKKAKLTVIQGSNLTIEAWNDLLTKRGPLSVAVGIEVAGGKRNIHALVVNCIKGDGTPNNTYIDFVDPADGKQYTKIPWSDFLKLYEGSANWPLQIIHW
jgi:hypothetical protein